jgi:hypothetical protein
MNDGLVKSPDAALRFIPRHCGVLLCTPHSSGLARLACELFTKPSKFLIVNAANDLEAQPLNEEISLWPEN